MDKPNLLALRSIKHSGVHPKSSLQVLKQLSQQLLVEYVNFSHQKEVEFPTSARGLYETFCALAKTAHMGSYFL